MPGTCYTSMPASSMISWPLFSFLVLRGYTDVLSLSPRAFPRRVKGGRRGRAPTSMRASPEGILRQYLPQLGSQLSRHSVQSCSDRCIQTNQFTARKGLGVPSLVKPDRVWRTEGNHVGESRRSSPWVRPGCWCSEGSPRSHSLVGVFLNLPPGDPLAFSSLAGLLSCRFGCTPCVRADSCPVFT